MRTSRGLSKDDFQGLVDPKHVYNLETAKSGVTLDTLEALASVLQVDALTLLTVAASLDRGQSHSELLLHLRLDAQRLAELGVITKMAWRISGRINDQARSEDASGHSRSYSGLPRSRLSRKETADEVGVHQSTVGRI